MISTGTCTLKLFTKVIYNAHAVLLTNALIMTIHFHLCLIFTGKGRSIPLAKVEYDNVMTRLCWHWHCCKISCTEVLGKVFLNNIFVSKAEAYPNGTPF